MKHHTKGHSRFHPKKSKAKHGSLAWSSKPQIWKKYVILTYIFCIRRIFFYKTKRGIKHNSHIHAICASHTHKYNSFITKAHIWWEKFNNLPSNQTRHLLNSTVTIRCSSLRLIKYILQMHDIQITCFDKKVYAFATISGYEIKFTREIWLSTAQTTHTREYFFRFWKLCINRCMYLYKSYRRKYLKENHMIASFSEFKN